MICREKRTQVTVTLACSSSLLFECDLWMLSKQRCDFARVRGTLTKHSWNTPRNSPPAQANHYTRQDKKPYFLCVCASLSLSLSLSSFSFETIWSTLVKSLQEQQSLLWWHNLLSLPLLPPPPLRHQLSVTVKSHFASLTRHYLARERGERERERKKKEKK